MSNSSTHGDNHDSTLVDKKLYEHPTVSADPDYSSAINQVHMTITMLYILRGRSHHT
ncbi:hypothetical protein DPMN_088868 [Dreissena polymorpha]|uniref:Uncharacterized protein n=1 Tax=Dreissena polymorpha TaxID=45954 RepID=A0A9D4KX27_DREPO|nr:hypothetical protein DPMN_088868 [Dreissena polymorpha]